MTDDDPTLLRLYAETRSEPAFTALVQRHLDLVYSAALRRLNGDAHRASDVAQSVFLSLARHAASLSRRPVLVSWLYTTTRHAAIDVIRTEQRRQAREQQAHAMEKLTTSTAASPEWERLRPILDGALDQLGEREREIVLLRFFENRAFAEVGVKLALSEDAARMRAARALEKLRVLLARQGVTSTAAALGTVLAGQTIQAAPAGLAVSVIGGALLGAASSGAAGTAAGILSFMAATKSLLTVAGVITAIAIGSAVYEAHIAQRSASTAGILERERNGLRAQVKDLDERLREIAGDLARSIVLQKEAEEKSTKTGTASKTPARSATNEPWSNPSYGPSYIASQRASLGSRFGLLYRALHLSPEQISKFEEAQIELQQSMVDIWTEAATRGLSTSDTSVARLTAEPYKIMETNLRSILGDSGFEQFQRYEKGRAVRELIATFAGNIYFTENPLSPAQGEQLAQIVQANTETKKIPMRDDGKKPMFWLRDETDWATVNSQVQSVLTDSQFAAFKAMGEQKRLQDELRKITNPR